MLLANQLTAENVYRQFTSDTQELSEAYEVARVAVYKEDDDPSQLANALSRLNDDHKSGILRPPLPSVLAADIDGAVKSIGQGELDIIANDKHQAAAKALLHVALQFEILRFGTDLSFNERRQSAQITLESGARA